MEVDTKVRERVEEYSKVREKGEEDTEGKKRWEILK